MTGKLINLRLARKRKTRAEAALQAKENRALYGRPLHETKLEAAEETRSRKAHDQHRLDAAPDRKDDDD
jgi:hypothetical protein